MSSAARASAITAPPKPRVVSALSSMSARTSRSTSSGGGCRSVTSTARPRPPRPLSSASRPATQPPLALPGGPAKRVGTTRLTASVVLSRRGGRDLEVGDQPGVRRLPVVGAQHRRRVDGHEELPRTQAGVALDQRAAVLRDPDRRAEQCLGGGCAEADDDVGVDDPQLLDQPRAAGRDVPQLRRLVDPSLAGPGLGELEVLHRIRPVGDGAVDAGLVDGLDQQPPGRPDERGALLVLDVPRLLADEDEPGVARAGREHRLGGRLPQLAAPAAGGGGPEPVEVGTRRHEVLRCHGVHSAPSGAGRSPTSLCPCALSATRRRAPSVRRYRACRWWEVPRVRWAGRTRMTAGARECPA